MTSEASPAPTFSAWSNSEGGSATFIMSNVREICTNLTGISAGDVVTECMLETFTEVEKAMFASRQYILTLWPVFVGAIVAIAPDPSAMLYDNIWWAALFCITCGGFPGLNESSGPPHHVTAFSETEGCNMCESWRYNASQPKARSKTDTMRPAGRGRRHLYLEWGFFLVGCGLWIAFNVYFRYSLNLLTDFAWGEWWKPYGWARAAAWYYASSCPALISIFFELLEDRVDLYEPVRPTNQFSSKEREAASSSSEAMKTPPAPLYKRVDVCIVFQLWLKIFLHQWRRSKFRILVRSSSTHWFFGLGRGIVGIARIAIFVLGSVTMGNILLFPVPNDYHHLGLLLCTTIVPRVVWPAFWTNGNRGADLVVFVDEMELNTEAS